MELDKYNKLINTLYEKLPFRGPFDFKEKGENSMLHMFYMLNRTQSLFKYDGLPDTIPARILELYLQVNGHVCFAEHNGDLYVFFGGLGGKPDVYYMPTIYTVSNPGLNFSANLKIDKDCVVIPNDSLYLGLMPMFTRYGSMLAENELSQSIAIINSRIIDLITAPDDATKSSAELFLEHVRDGDLGVMADNAFLEGIKTLPYGSTSRGNQLTQLIEFEQYLKAAWFNDLGLNANYNMKREALSTAESQLNDDALLPLIDNMLEMRRIGLEKVNNMFGTNIAVDFGSAWEDNQIELALEQAAMEEAAEDPEPENPEETPEETPEEKEGGVSRET